MRLIDANLLMAEMHNVILKDGDDRSIFYEVIERQPTIDPAENGGCWGCQCALQTQEAKKPEILPPEPIAEAAVKLGENLGDFINAVIEYLYEKEEKDDAID